MALLYSRCHPSAAACVPYICFSSSPQLDLCSASSVGNDTNVGFAGSHFALKYAREMSINEICSRLGESGLRHLGFWPSISVAA